ncbi:hypothetical protein BDN67DRAFT_708599 [Paxillus ammoniavirescens]|nr:hypothetical protein BDN67DRAFT_708599 [Paxillus ammoniavirescens]
MTPPPSSPEPRPLELRWLNRSIWRTAHSDIRFQDIDVDKANQILIRGLRALSNDTLQKLVLAKQATRETQRHRLLTLAWEIEETDRHINLLKAMKIESEKAFTEVSEETEFFEGLLSSRINNPGLDNDIDFLHEAYDEDMTCKKQLDQLEGCVLDKGLARLDLGDEGVGSGMVDEVSA